MDYVRFHATMHGDSPAVSDLSAGREFSYRTLDLYVARCTSYLTRQNCSPGDRVACLARNSADVLALSLACARLGAIFVPLNWRLSDAELNSLLEDCSPKCLFADQEDRHLNVEVTPLQDLESLCETAEPSWPEMTDQHRASLMLYTSGTTGSPKGVVLSERNLNETALNSVSLLEVNSDSRFLCESPMFHIIGMVSMIRPALFCGGRVFISDGFEAERTMRYLSDLTLKISHFFCVPQMALALRNATNFDPSKLSHMKAIFTGGAPHPEAQIRAWLRDGVRMVDGYGMSEAGTVFGMPIDPKLIEGKAGCVGVPTPRIEARLVDDSGAVVQTNMPGELQLRGANIARFYWSKDGKYKATTDREGWFSTGDILVQDDDGFFRVADRKKDMFISGGENVYPAEVEAQLIDCDDLVEFAVVGVPDDKWGEVGCVFYVPQAGPISLGSIETFLSPRLARYKIPKHIRAVDSLPRNGVGKVLKTELRKIFLD